MVWLDLDVKLAPDTGTPSVKAHWGTVILANGRPIRLPYLVLIHASFSIL